MPEAQLHAPMKNLLYRLYAKSNRSVEKGPVFIVGTGRSGTHLMCNCLRRFEPLDDYFGGRESPWKFEEIASNTVQGKALSLSSIGYYKYMCKRVAPKVLIDQTHPNLWNVENLLEEFPNAKFVGMIRNVHSVIYSMKKHGGVSKWAKNHNRYHAPNPFLGLTEANSNLYRNELTLLQKNVFRWCSHKERITQLRSSFPESIMVVYYEELGTNMRSEIKRIADFIGIPPPQSYVNFEYKSLDKKYNLTDKELGEIDVALELWESTK